MDVLILSILIVDIIYRGVHALYHYLFESYILQVAAEAEAEENKQEQRRQYKRRLRYGQIIQV